jgi:uncharacterized membrane protein YoaT (DUF817 family)
MRLPVVLAIHATDSTLQGLAREILAFVWQQAWCCVFPVAIFVGLVVTAWCEPVLARYDAMLLLCLLMQVAMVRSGLESRDELKVITVFHLLGLGLELWKVHHGSWTYPGAGYSKIAGVPLYAGFMYASVASYMCQAWRRLDLQVVAWPASWQTSLLGSAIYLNFFTNRYLPDARWGIFLMMVVVFRNTWVSFRCNGPLRRMPLILSFICIGFFIWFAENFCTFFNAWRYPYQHAGWQAVHLQKLTSWFLLVIVSFVLIAHLKRIKSQRTIDLSRIAA